MKFCKLISCGKGSKSGEFMGTVNGFEGFAEWMAVILMSFAVDAMVDNLSGKGSFLSCKYCEGKTLTPNSFAESTLEGNLGSRFSDMSEFP